MNNTKGTPQIKKAVKYWARHLNILIRCYLREHTSEGGEIAISVGCASKFETSNKFVLLLHP